MTAKVFIFLYSYDPCSHFNNVEYSICPMALLPHFTDLQSITKLFSKWWFRELQYELKKWQFCYLHVVQNLFDFFFSSVEHKRCFTDWHRSFHIMKVNINCPAPKRTKTCELGSITSLSYWSHTIDLCESSFNENLSRSHSSWRDILPKMKNNFSHTHVDPNHYFFFCLCG